MIIFDRFVTQLLPLCMALVVAGPLSAQQAVEVGIWSWSQDAFVTDEAREELLSFCQREGISHIDQHVSIKRSNSGDETVQNGQALAQLIAEAAKRNISVNALRGERTMFFEKNHERGFEQLRALVEFDQQLDEGAHLAGIKYDVEPYLTDEWRAGGKEREKVMTDYLGFLQRARKHLDGFAPSLELCVDVPFWWDKQEFAVEIDGETKALVHHVQDLADWMAIMSYRTETRDVLRLVEEERGHARSNERPHSVSPGLNVIAIKGEERATSFADLPSTKFRNVLAELRSSLGSSGETRSIMLHDYKSLVTYLQTAE